MKKKLLALMAKKNERKVAINTQVDKSTDVAEVRNLSQELDTINGEIRSLQEMIDGLPDETAPVVERTAVVNGEIPGVVIAGAQQEQRKGDVVDDKFGTMEYRKAFMAYCQSGTEIPAEYRIDAFTAVADTAAMVPTTILNEVIKEMKQHGQLFNRVRKLNVQGGVQIPILSLKPTATRITEATPSDRKKVTANTYISFGYIGLECKVATSLIANAVTVPAFEAAIIPLITEAMIKQCEIEIIKGVGSTEMLGVAVDPRVLAGQIITLSAADMVTWDGWKKKVFAKIPLSYRSGSVFVMGAGTFDGYIDGMVDANGQPIGRTNYGIADSPAYRFGGKEVIEVEEDVITSYDSAAVGDVIAVLMNPSDYAINSNMQMAMFRWLDHDTNQWVDKAILVNDGKLIDAAGVLIIKKGA